MKQFFQKFSQSAAELKNLRSLTLLGMLMALYCVLKPFLTVQIMPTMKISFSFLIFALMGILCGPFCAGLAAAACDVITYFITPQSQSLFFGFTITAALVGVVYGVAFYKMKCSVLRVVIAQCIVNILLHCILNSVWLTLMLGKGAIVPRIFAAGKNIALLPVEMIMLYLITKGAVLLMKRLKLYRPAVS